MPNYKLIYFNSRGFVEPARQILALQNIDFEDIRLQHGNTEQFEKVEQDLPFGKVPVLQIDDFKVPQSTAIVRYLARQFGYAGKTPEEEAWVDAIVDQYKDFTIPLLQYLYAVQKNEKEEELARIKKETAEPALESFMKIIHDILEKSESGFLVGNSLTFADLVIADNLVTMKKLGFYDMEKYPKMDIHRNKIHSMDKLREWIEKRPDNMF